MAEGSRMPWLGWVLFASAFAVLEMAVLFEFALPMMDSFKLTGYLVIPVAVVSVIMGMFLGRIKRVSGARLAFGFLFFVFLMPAWLVAIRPFDPYSGEVILRALVGLVVAAGVGRVLASHWDRYRFLPWALFAVVLAVSWGRTQRPEPAGDPMAVEALRTPTEDRVLLVGVDGATWDVIDPLVAAGELPTFERLYREGARGTLISTISPIMPMSNSASGGMRSPVLWTSVITGREPRDHGILDMEVTYVPGLQEPLPFRVPVKWNRFVYQPVNAGMQKVKTLWTVLSEHGMRVGSVAWWPSWPIESINGFIVSDRYRGEADGSGRVFPADLVDRYGMVDLFEDFDVGNIFVDCDDVGLDHSFVPARLTRMFRHDHFAGVVAPQLLAGEDWDFASVYVKAPDVAQHYFWQWHDPQLRSSRPRYQDFPYDPVVGAYRHIDDVLAALMASVDERTTIIMVSDHGAGTWEEEHGFVLQLWDKQEARDRWMGNHRPDGIFVVWGRGAEPEILMEKTVGLVDVAPTVLHLLGFPVADDLDGRVALEALATDGAGGRPVARVASYETENRRAVFEVDPSLDASIEADLRSLGYLN